jgi:hypothetical protein
VEKAKWVSAKGAKKSYEVCKASLFNKVKTLFYFINFCENGGVLGLLAASVLRKAYVSVLAATGMTTCDSPAPGTCASSTVVAGVRAPCAMRANALQHAAF